MWDRGKTMKFEVFSHKWHYYSVAEPEMDWELAAIMDMSFRCGLEGLTRKVSTPTLNFVCVRDDWIEIVFEIVYLKLTCFLFIIERL